MEVVAESHSMYPRVGESEEDLRLRRAHHQYDRDEISEQERDRIIDSYVEELIQEQQEAGVNVVTDGMVRWYDHVSHLASGLRGTEVAGLVRFFDTNYLVREARVVDRIGWDGPILGEEFEFARSVSDRPVKAVLTGPFTLARHSILDEGPYESIEECARGYAEALRQEVDALRQAGANHLQLEEPSLLQSPPDADWVLELVAEVLEPAGDMHTRLATYFGDAAPLYDELQSAPNVDSLVLDFTYSDQLSDRIISTGSSKSLVLGLLNGRNTKLADTEHTVRLAREILQAAGDGTHGVSTSCSLDFLPRDRALRKLKHLSRIRDGLTEGAVQV